MLGPAPTSKSPVLPTSIASRWSARKEPFPALPRTSIIRSLLDDSSIDAVFIATPQHLHATQFLAALDAGKHVYLEKTAALNLAEAKKMRAAVQKDGGRHTIAIGHQSCSAGHMADVQQFLSDPNRMGKITAISMQLHRSTPLSKAQWARPALFTPSLTKENIAWQEFLGYDARPRFRSQPLRALALLLGIFRRRRV